VANGNPFLPSSPQRGTAPSFAGILDQFGRTQPPTTDPAFQPPSDPLKDKGATVARARLIHREIPNVTVQPGWSIQDVRTTLQDLTAGIFDRPAQLQDAIAADSRVQSAMKALSGGLLGAPITFKIPKKYRSDPDAKKCHRIWERHWQDMHAEPALLDLLETSSSLGFAYAQILWDTSGKYWKPYLQSFNARYSYYHWLLRAHVVITLDGQVPVTPGDGHWILHAPYGQYRGWMRGALRALAQWWLARNYALRDWARYCERHGFPLFLADCPFGADPNDIANFQATLQGVGQETILQLPGSVDVTKYGKYDLRYLEPKDENWQAFKELIIQCNNEITMALLGQNLTSEVKEGSLAAARVHANVLQMILESNARAAAKTLYVQVLRPFAALNFGDPRIAPIPCWNVSPDEDFKMKADTADSASRSLNQLRQAGFKVKDPARYLKQFGLKLGDVEAVDPLQVEARAAGSTGKAEEDAEADGGGGGDPKDAAASGKKPKKKPKKPETPEQSPPPEPPPPKKEEASFAQRHAAFLADIKDLRELKLPFDLAELAAQHGVPVPTSYPSDPDNGR